MLGVIARSGAASTWQSSIEIRLMVQVRSKQTNKFRRDAWLEINLDNLEHNLKALYKEFNKPLIPVLKADAYGHGASVIVQTLDAYKFIQAYGVASIDEALSLRENTEKPIIILGVSPDWAIDQALEHNIELTVASIESATAIAAKSQDKKTRIHLKIDTGMNRIGFKPEKFSEALKLIEAQKNLEIASIFTHFADTEDLVFCAEQKNIFDKLTKGLNYPKHLASSKAARLFPGEGYNYVRCGIELYGLENPKLKPLLSLYSRISFIKTIKQGESVGYKRTWITDKDTQIATLPLGYADGIPRLLSNKITGFCKGHEIKQVGSVTMDQIMFDIGLDSDIKTGDIVELIGKHQSIENWAKEIGTISYELVSNLSLRLPKTYTR